MGELPVGIPSSTLHRSSHSTNSNRDFYVPARLSSNSKSNSFCKSLWLIELAFGEFMVPASKSSYGGQGERNIFGGIASTLPGNVKYTKFNGRSRPYSSN